jgi:hypothetical protein
MKNLLKILLIIVSISFINCDNSDSTDSNNPPNNEKLIHTIDNGETAVFIYEGDKIMKGIGNTGYNAFQVEYQNNKVKRVYVSDQTYFPQPFNFTFDLSNGNFPNIVVMDYNYSNNKLVSISVDGFNVYNFIYDSSGRITEEIRSGLPNSNTKFFYDSNGKVTSYIKTQNSSIETGLILTDSFVNPIYILWNKYNFVFPPDLSTITNFNKRYFPNNTIGVYDEDEVLETVTMSYNNNNYPISFTWNGFNDLIGYLE